MKKIFVFAFIGVCLMMGSCGNKQQQQQSTENDTTEFVDDKPISIYGTCGDGSAMNTLQLVTDAGDTLNLAIRNSQDSVRVLGGYDAGDRMAVLVSSDRKNIVLAINETTILGDWWQPNPIDGTSYMGIRFKDGGTAESLDQNGIVFKAWKIINGKLVLTYYREGGVEEDEITEYSITRLDGDSLIFGAGDDVFDYGRKHTRKADL